MDTKTVAASYSMDNRPEDDAAVSLTNAQLLLEQARAEAEKALEAAEKRRTYLTEQASTCSREITALRAAIARYNVALGARADGTPRKSRRKEVTAEPDRASTCTGAVDANSEDSGNP